LASNYLPHQIKAASEITQVLRTKGLAYLFGEVRSGKTRTMIKVCESSKKKRILVLTKKQAIGGVERELKAVGAKKHYTVTNFEKAAKLTPGDYDFAVIDEAHCIGPRGKPTQRVKAIHALTYELPVLLMSGSPMSESPLSVYHQFWVTKYSPFAEFKTFYKFFAKYGIPCGIPINGRIVEQYKKARPELLKFIEPWIVRMTQEDAGIEYKAIDKVHKVHLNSDTLAILETIKEDKVINLDGHTIAMESDMKERVVLHQLEAGALKLDDGNIIETSSTEIVDYIRDTWGDRPEIAIMAHFHSTKQKIETHLPNVHVFSSDGHAEGTDLSNYEHFIIVNTGYSGAKHIQRRDRGVNINRSREAVVHHIVCEGQLSEAVYKAVSKKKDFNIQSFRRIRNGKTS